MNSRQIWIITLFPNHFESLLDGGVIAQALSGQRGIEIKLNLVQLRDFSPKDYKGVDDKPYGGGQGQVIRADVLKRALEYIMTNGQYEGEIQDSLHVVYTSPRGYLWKASSAKDFAFKHWSENSKKDLVFICGRYEGIDERFIQKYVDEEISLGDYVLSGGELAVMTILDSSMRFIPGVLGNEDSALKDSFEGLGLLESPCYTKPAEFEGMPVPAILVSGNHKKIKDYREAESLRITKEKRADLYEISLEKIKENSK